MGKWPNREGKQEAPEDENSRLTHSSGATSRMH